MRTLIFLIVLVIYIAIVIKRNIANIHASGSTVMEQLFFLTVFGILVVVGLRRKN